MSFGYGAGDLITLLMLAKRVYDTYRAAPGEFQSIVIDVEMLRAVIEDLEQQLPEYEQLDTNFRTRIELMKRGCEDVLVELENLMKNYKSLDTASADGPRKWDRVKWFQENIEGLRQKIGVRISLVLMLNSSLLQ